MREQTVRELVGIFQAVAIFSPTSFSFAGRPVTQPGQAAQQFQNPYPQQNPVVAELQRYLYQYCFVQKFKGHISDEPVPAAQEDNLLQSLSQANTSRERWDPGWQIYQVLPSGQVVAHKYGFTRTLWAGEFISHEGQGAAPRAGAHVSVFFPKESLTMQPGSYFAFGETVADQYGDYRLVRFYWNVKADGAAGLMRFITQSLNRFQVTFRLKCPDNSRAYTRLDAAVLYVNKRFYRITAELLADVYRGAAEHLEPETPIFTKRLAPGLALAEDPGNGESFGTSRCRIVAEGIWNAYVRGFQTEQARLHGVISQFTKYGLDFERPYLNPGSVEQYEFSGFRG